MGNSGDFMNIQIRHDDSLMLATSTVDHTFPIRSDFRTPEELVELGRVIAEAKSVDLLAFDGLKFARRFDDNERATLANHAATAEAARNKQMFTPSTANLTTVRR
jgi:hypothetical protein